MVFDHLGSLLFMPPDTKDAVKILSRSIASFPQRATSRTLHSKRDHV